MERHVVIGTSGHIDHGKSSLVLALTGTDPDRLKEEKARGITIDLGFAHYAQDGVVFSFVDVPGHERFVKNMLAGVSGIDAVLLVVAADESVMPQTREHFDICRLLRVRHGVVVLTKADLVDDDTVALVRLEVRDLVAGSFLESAPVVAVSSRTGEGLAELRLELRHLADRTPQRVARGAFRLPIDRVFSVRGFGTVVTGTVSAGTVRAEQELMVAPGDRRVKVRGVQVHGTGSVQAAAGQRVALNLGGVEVADLVRGDTLMTGEAFAVTRRFDATLQTLPGGRPIKHGARVRFHHGTSEVLGRLAVSKVFSSQAEGDALIPPDARAYVRVRLEAPAVLTRGDRFVVRAYSPPVTIAGGEVLDPEAPRGPTRSRAQLARFERLDPTHRSVGGDSGSASAVDEAVAVGMEEAGGLGLTLDALTRRFHVPPDEHDAVAARAVAARRAVRVGNRLVSQSVVDALRAGLVESLRAFHQREPLADGLSREEARDRLFGKGAPDVFDAVVAALGAGGVLTVGAKLALATHKVAVSGGDAPVLAQIEDAYRAGGLKPPDRAGLEATTGAAPAVVERLVQLLLRQRVLVRVDTLVFHVQALDRLKTEIKALKNEGRSVSIDVGTFKDRFGVSRKFAIPLLEFLDRERITRRSGDTRTIL